MAAALPFRCLVPGYHPMLALRMALKGLRRSRGTTLLGVLVLTLGLAAPTTFFSLLVGAIRPLPVPEGDRVVRVEVVQPSRRGRQVPATLSDVQALRRSGSLEALGAFRTFSGTLLEPGRTAARFSGAALTSDVLSLLRVEPVLGRFPEPSEAGETLLLSHRLWVDAFEGDPEVLGRVVSLGKELRSVVGVMPERFRFPFNQTAWTILEEGLADDDPVELVGRLASGASETAASAELGMIWTRGDPHRGQEWAGGVLDVDGFTSGRGERGEGIAFLGLVLVAVALLLIACANVANLLLVRATERVKNLAVQAAVGAGRAQIGLQLFLEALFLALLGGMGGALLAWTAVDAIERVLAAEHFGYFWMRMAVDGRVLLFISALVVGTALIAGVLPIIRVMRVDLQGVLQEEIGGVAFGGGGVWSRSFVTVQLALSCGALVAAGLTGISLIRGSSLGHGLAGEEVFLASLTLPQDRDPAIHSLLEGALSSVPGVEAVAMALGAPGYMEPWNPLELERVGVVRPQDRESVIWNAVNSSFFSVFGMENRSGRLFTPADSRDAPRVAVVSRSFAERFFPGEDPLGSRVSVTRADSAMWFTIVGVTDDLELGGGPRERKDRVYLPLDQVRAENVLVILRAAAASPNLPRQIRETVSHVDSGLPVWSVRTLAEAHAYLIRVPRTMAYLALGGGLAGLLVAAVGLYGLLAFRVRQRRRELGLRLALGAHGAVLARGVFTLALKQLAGAVAAGLVLAWMAAPMIGAALLGGDPRSPLIYLGVGTLFLAVGLGAAAAPALRAACLDPAQVLRGD